MVDKIAKILKFLKDEGISIEEALSILGDKDTWITAWNYTEIKQESYSFKEAINWIKKYFDPGLHTSASITKEVRQDGTIILNCCLINKEGEALTRPKDPFLRVTTRNICQDLKNNFGDKDLIVIK